MNYQEITTRYYSKWIGEENAFAMDNTNIKFIYSPERNKIQYGYGQRSDLYVFFYSNKVIFSYGDKLIAQIEEIKKHIHSAISLDAIKNTLSQLFSIPIQHNVKYCFNKLPEKQLHATLLTDADYTQYYQFFTANNPNCKNTSWLNEYFTQMVRSHMCSGLFMDNILVSCSDVPGMPYMQDEVQEIGINTLEGYKGNGYATDVCILCASEIIKNGKCPQWSTLADNIASQKLAERVGFIRFADVLTITL
ncbi:MAG: GNAT family N-acetyltransferase [Cellulosilyticaceae bacterium]